MQVPAPRVVLVEPSHPGNIGSAARAMKTMGLEELVLVRPTLGASVCANHEAVRRAVGAADVLAKARVETSLEHAVGDCRLVVGCTARQRTHGRPTLNVRAAAAMLCEESPQGPVAAVFGPETSGLANADLDLCTRHLFIPTAPDFGSLNLGSAVQIVAYEIHLARLASPDALERPPRTPRHERDQPANAAELAGFYAHLEAALDDSGFLADSRREAAISKLRALFGRARPRKGELQMLRGVVRSLRPGAEPPS